MTEPFTVRIPQKGEEWCPFFGTAYHLVPGYEEGYGCPCCKAISHYHIPITKEELNKYLRKKKRLIKKHE